MIGVCKYLNFRILKLIKFNWYKINLMCNKKKVNEFVSILLIISIHLSIYRRSKKSIYRIW